MSVSVFVNNSMTSKVHHYVRIPSYAVLVIPDDFIYQEVNRHADFFIKSKY